MGFCPSCRTEYSASVQTCADCDVTLVAELEVTPPSTGDTVDVVRCYDPQEAARVVELLSAAGLVALVRDHSSAFFPTNVGSGGERVVAVTAADADRARAMIRGAQQDGVLADQSLVV